MNPPTVSDGPSSRKPPGVQGVVEGGDDPLLQRRGEVDQQLRQLIRSSVREGRVAGHVLPGEDAHVADRLADPVAAVLLGEEPPQPLRARPRASMLCGIDPGAGLLDGGRIVDVGAEDLDRRAARPAGRRNSSSAMASE